MSEMNREEPNKPEEMKTLEVIRTIIIISIIIIATVTMSILFVIQPAFWNKFIFNENTAHIATTIGGMSALIVQSVCVIALYLTFKEQKEANNIQKKIYDAQQNMNKKQIEKLESDIKLSMYQQLTDRFYKLKQKFEAKTISDKVLHHSFSNIKEDMKKNPETLDEVLYFLNSFLSDLRYHIEYIKNEEITEERKKNLVKEIKDFIKNNFDQNIYNRLENNWKFEYRLQQQREEIEELLR
jgi:hypothetical protein